jgi:elongation factor P
MALKATQMRVGNIILRDGELFRVDSMDHVTPGKGRAHVQTLLRNLRTGASYDVRFRSDDSVEKAILETVEMEYLYADGDSHIFMNNDSYEQMPLPEELLGNAMDYLLPNTTVQVEMHDGRPVGLELPNSVKLKVVETEPPLKGATAAGSAKPATLETGLVVNVPQFVDVDDVIEVDTRSGAYLTRA